MIVFYGILSLLSMFYEQGANAVWCSPNIDSNQRALTVSDVEYMQPTLSQGDRALMMLRNRGFVSLGSELFRSLTGMNADRGYDYYLVRAIIHSNANSTMSERRERLDVAYKSLLFDRSSRTLNLHIAQMYRGQMQEYRQPLIVRLHGIVRKYNLFCHAAE